MRLPLLIFIILLFKTIVLYGQPSGEEQYLRRGLEMEQSGEYERVLDLWEETLSKLEIPSLAIGREYIRLTTEQKLHTRYQTAAAMFRWGLSAENIDPNQKSLEVELAMLEPIIDEQTYERWQSLLEEKNPTLYEQLHLFWQKVDPTPATSYNERLLEHWERIAYAHKHFTNSDNTIFNTDDRGISWIKYGKPDREHVGRLTINSGRVSTLIDILDPNLDEVQKNALRNATVDLHKNPRYEIWIYRSYNEEMGQNLVLLFGDKSSGGYERLETPGEFIPSQAFTFSDRYKATQLRSRGEQQKAKITPGMIMLYLYYEQLATKDAHFAQIYNQITSEWEGDTRRGQNQALNISAGPFVLQQAEMTSLQNIKKAPNQISTYEKEFPNIPMEIYQYRLLSEKDQPVFVTFLESYPQQVFINDLAVNEDSMFTGKFVSVEQAFSNYELFHGLQIRNPDGEILSQSRVPTTLALDSTNTEPSTSVFTVPLLPKKASPLFYAELHNRHPKSSPQIESPFKNSLRGHGKTQLIQIDPLLPKPNKLQMSDLIMGYQMQRNSSDGMFPFVVSNDQKIPVYENLVVHVELYHLQPKTDGISRFQLSYEILPDEALDWTRERKQEFSLTLNMETKQTRYIEDLEIETSELPTGRYIFRMRATEPESGRRIQRNIKFEVIEDF